MSTIRISRLAARGGVPATTLRFYESAALAAGREYCPAPDFRLHLDGPVRHPGVPAPDEDAPLLAELLTTAV
ncbi:hypothetical protein [Streptomyces sp. SM11]|uniref:hypothetical protein n=1 Tax=Streptomyces sp. SM11 TaxID=565557 RepID=UPI0021562EAA|nr:hypothetical protein [Streptomyces sp. SM11]